MLRLGLLGLSIFIGSLLYVAYYLIWSPYIVLWHASSLSTYYFLLGAR